MTALEKMSTYLRRLELRFRLLLASRGTAATAISALVLTLVLVWTGNRFEFAERVMPVLRWTLYLLVAAVIVLALAIPLLRFNRARATKLAEKHIPGLEQRLLTVVERPDPANPFIEILAEDTLRIAKENRLEELASSRWALAFLGSGLAALAFIIWLIAAGPGYWSYGASLLWTGNALASRRPLYDIAVEPGNRTVRRKSDQLITAKLLGFSAHSTILHAKYASSTKWEEIPMQPMPEGNGYRFVFAALSEPLEYYVQANSTISKHYQLRVKDLPGVKRVRVAVHSPARLQLKDVVNDPGGDIRAVEGSRADVAVLTDRPLEHGVLVLENGQKVPLEKAEGNWLKASLPVTKDGSYHVAAVDEGELIRISDDFFIEAKKDEPPSVRIVRPGRDPHVSPIEEVPVTVEAADDFGLEGLELHYSVNGGSEQTVPLMKDKGTKEETGSTTLYLENFKLVPGDIVSFYATAKDASTTTRTPIVFAQAEPFDFKFSQSQQAGGGMGMGMGGQDDELISERQKQIIAATWNELKGAPKGRSAAEEDARFLSDLEGKLQAQAKTLADRMNSRELTSASPEFENFSKMMVLASTQLGEAAEQLKPGRWNDAMAPEQKALQSLLRAEATFRNIQVAFGQRGGGMGGSGAQRDLARMFDLELDTSKNQYETEQSPSQSANAQQKAIDEAFAKLQALAQRQQELAEQNSQQQQFDQRWQEEQLRREAEELRQQLQQLAQNSQQNSQQNQGSPQQGQSSSQQGSSGGRSSNAQNRAQQDAQNREMSAAMRQATQALERAEDEMRRAVSERDNTARQRAAQQLAQAQNALDNALQQRAGSSVSEMADRAQQIANTQQDLARRMKEMYGSRSARNDEFSTPLEGNSEMPEMNDPENPRYGYGYRRRFWPDLREARPASGQEKAIANEKDQLGQELQRLEKQMQQQAQSLAATQPDAASKMRKALSDAEQKELALRMQKEAEWLRKGYGDRNAGMEDSVTAGVQELSRDLREVQKAVGSEQPGQNGQNGKANDALAQVESLRRMLESAQQARNGQQNGNGEQGMQRGENQQGGNPQNGQGGSEAQRAGEPGSYSMFGGANPTIDRNTLDNTIHQLYTLRNQISGKDRALYNYIDGTLGYLRDLNANPKVLQTTIGDDAVASLERLEIELSKRTGEQSTLGARTGAREAAPEKYQDAVAEYFKKLSQPNNK